MTNALVPAIANRPLALIRPRLSLCHVTKRSRPRQRLISKVPAAARAWLALALDRAPAPPPRRTPLALALDRSMRRYSPDGFLTVARTILSEARVDAYLAEEIPDWQQHGLIPGRKYQLLRHPDEMRKAVPSFNSLVLLVGHRPVTSQDIPHDLICGCTGDSAVFDGRYLTNSLTVWDANATAGIERGELRDISLGYHYRYVPTPGTWQGRPVDGTMVDLIGNHCSLVDAGRVPSARVAL